MNYTEASELRERNLHLIGKKFNGQEIEDLVVAPTSQEEWERFIRLYLYNDYDRASALRPFINSSLGVIALFGRAYIDDGFFFFESINNLGVHLDIR